MVSIKLITRAHISKSKLATYHLDIFLIYAIGQNSGQVISNSDLHTYVL